MNKDLLDFSELPDITINYDNDEITSGNENYTEFSNQNNDDNHSENDIVISTTGTMYSKEDMTPDTSNYSTEPAKLVPLGLPKYYLSDNNVQAKNAKQFIVYTATTDEKNFRIYLTGDTNILSPLFHLKFAENMMKIQSMPQAESITIEMGSMFGGCQPTFVLGTMISMIKQCRIPVKTVASSRCSFAESAIWLFGGERTISQYGALQFTGVKDFLKDFPMAKAYIETIYEEALATDTLDEDDVKFLLEGNNSIFITKDGKIRL